MHRWIRNRAARWRAKPARKILRFESLECRRVFSLTATATPVTLDDFLAECGAASAPDTDVESLSAAPIATNLSLADGDAIVIVRGGLEVQVFSSSEATDLERGDALRAAFAQAQPGDEILLGAYVFDLGGLEHIEFPANVTVTGAGKEATRISSSVPQWIDGAAPFTLNDQTVVQDCWLEGTLYDGSYQTLVGMAAIPDQDITTYLRRVKITGDSDGIFIWTNQNHTYRLYAYDCDISTRYDAVAVLGTSFNPQYVELWNCTLTVQQPTVIPQHISNCVNLQTGVVRLFNCSLNAKGDSQSVQTAGVWAWNLGVAEVYNCTFNVSDPTGTAFDFLIQGDGQVTVSGGQGSGPGGSYTSNDSREVYEPAPNSSVVGRAVFYNNSAFDGQDPAANVADAAAIATDKSALLPGQLAATPNYTNYSRGINGLIVGLAGPHGPISADDFEFRIGNSLNPDEWMVAPAPLSVTILGGEGAGDSERVEIVWQDGAIRNTWLQVRMLATADTGLATDDVFYWGNRVADSGVNLGADTFTTSSTDAAFIFYNLGPDKAITDPRDYNHDGQITSTDAAIVFLNIGILVRLNAPTAEPLTLAADELTSTATPDNSTLLPFPPPTARWSVFPANANGPNRSTGEESQPPPTAVRHRAATLSRRAVRDAGFLDGDWLSQW